MSQSPRQPSSKRGEGTLEDIPESSAETEEEPPLEESSSGSSSSSSLDFSPIFSLSSFPVTTSAPPPVIVPVTAPASAPVFTAIHVINPTTRMGYFLPAPQFSASIVVAPENSYVPSDEEMSTSHSIQSCDYPVFGQYGYFQTNGKYRAMAKKGSTRQKAKALVRRGSPKLATIKEEPELEDFLSVLNKENQEKNDVNINNNNDSI